MSEELTRILSKMDVPHFRRNVGVESNVRWLLSNLGIRNASNPDYPKAKDLLKRLLNQLQEKRARKDEENGQEEGTDALPADD